MRLGSARYSVPARLRGQVVQVLVDGDEVRVFHEGSEGALHRLQPPGGASIQDEHYPRRRRLESARCVAAILPKSAS